MPTNHERLIAQLKRRQRVCVEATAAMLKDLKAAGLHEHPLIILEHDRNTFIWRLEGVLEEVPDPDRHLTDAIRGIKQGV